MKWFSFDFLKSSERKELEQLRKEKENNIVLKTDGTGDISGWADYKPKEELKPYKNIYLSGDIATIVLHNGMVYTMISVTQSFIEMIKKCSTAEEIEKLCSPLPVSNDTKHETTEEKALVSNNLAIFKTHSEGKKYFDIKGKDVFMKKVSLAIPAIIVSSFIELLERNASSIGEATKFTEQFNALRYFWIKLALNGLEQSRNDLLLFCKKNDVKLTKRGNLILYRRVVSTGIENKDLVKAISQNYFQIKKWKKSPKNYWLWCGDTDYELLNKKPKMKSDGIGCLEGNLYELYKNLDKIEANTYTAYHGKKTVIKIGSVYSIPEQGINLDNGICAAGGLHAACVNYDYSGFGDTPVVVLVNPSKAITVPTGDTGKLRTTEMFVACINDKPQGVHFDEDSLSVFDEEYNDLTVKELETAIKAKSFSPAAVVDEISPITALDIDNIKDMLKERITNI